MPSYLTLKSAQDSRATAYSRDDATLLRADEVARLLGVRLKRVYELDIPFVLISARSKRWRLRDVLAWIERRSTGVAA